MAGALDNARLVQAAVRVATEFWWSDCAARRQRRPMHGIALGLICRAIGGMSTADIALLSGSPGGSARQNLRRYGSALRVSDKWREMRRHSARLRVALQAMALQPPSRSRSRSRSRRRAAAVGNQATASAPERDEQEVQPSQCQEMEREVTVVQPAHEQQACPICLEALEAPLVTPCNHVFCALCITRALVEKHECPTCRARVPTRRSCRAPGGGLLGRDRAWLQPPPPIASPLPLPYAPLRPRPSEVVDATEVSVMDSRAQRARQRGERREERAQREVDAADVAEEGVVVVVLDAVAVGGDSSEERAQRAHQRAERRAQREEVAQREVDAVDVAEEGAVVVVLDAVAVGGDSSEERSQRAHQRAERRAQREEQREVDGRADVYVTASRVCQGGGLFAAKHLPAHHPIGEYIGERLNPGEAAKLGYPAGYGMRTGVGHIDGWDPDGRLLLEDGERVDVHEWDAAAWQTLRTRGVKGVRWVVGQANETRFINVAGCRKKPNVTYVTKQKSRQPPHWETKMPVRAHQELLMSSKLQRIFS